MLAEQPEFSTNEQMRTLLELTERRDLLRDAGVVVGDLRARAFRRRRRQVVRVGTLAEADDLAVRQPHGLRHDAEQPALDRPRAVAGQADAAGAGWACREAGAA